MNQQEEMLKRFDELFGYEISEMRKEYKNYLSKPEDIKSFIQSEINLALSNRDKEIVEMIDDTRYKVTGVSSNHDIHRCGYNDALDDIINLITKANKE